MRTVAACAAAFIASTAMLAIVFGFGADPARPATVSVVPPEPSQHLTTASPIVASADPKVAVPSAVPLTQLRLSIERLGISLPLAPGDVGRDVIAGATPEGVALLFPGTPVPGTGGNSFIYAHARAGMFLGLWDVQLGDRVEVASAGGIRFRYLVTQIVQRVDPADGTWLDQAGPERITLQTSTGPNSAFPRFIAVATRLPQTGD